ncbi:MAG TPA: hypothetical protein VK669_10590 [Candidatus Limnocylindrales bacterium]|nr:hypothetical protein [Candidatus Limnocylindrales bacterium]
MMRRVLLATACSVIAAGLPAMVFAQGNAPAVKPLRTLVYSVQYSVSTTNEEKTSGFDGNNVPTPYGSATTRRSSSVDEAGTLTADVVAATPDGGLAVDAAFAGKSAAQPSVRVVVYPDGRLSAPPSAQLGPEALRLLPLLARGIVANRTVTPGSSWSLPVAPPAKGAYTFHVMDVDGDTAKFGIDVDMAVPGPQGYDEHGKATATYDTAKLCPLSYDYTGTSRHSPAMDQYVTTTAHFTARLLSDSFAKK